MINKTACALICEYNPFHMGHKYQMELLKSKFDIVVCIMSGSTVQRGEFAIFDKHTRAAAAVAEGADIVLELPYPYSSLGARDFAAAGVHIAVSLGIPTLAFGAEDAVDTKEVEVDKLGEIVKLLRLENTRGKISALQKEKPNLSYPKVRQEYVRLKLGKEYAKLLLKPNNILAIEYMISGGDRISYYTIKRNQKLKSATELRGMPNEEMLKNIPKAASNILSSTSRRNIQNLGLAIISKLRTSDVNTVANIYDVTPDLAFRLIKSAEQATSYSEILNLAASATETSAKLRRVLLHCLIGASKEDATTLPGWTQLLSAKKECLPFLNKLTASGFPVLSKPAHYKRLPEKQIKQFLLSRQADDVAALSAMPPEPAGLSMITSPTIV